MDTPRGALGNAIKKARKDKKLTQSKLAEQIDISLLHVQQVESGRRNPSVEVLFDIALALDLSLDSFLSSSADGTQEMKNKINIGLSDFSVNELNVVYATIEAMRKND